MGSDLILAFISGITFTLLLIALCEIIKGADDGENGHPAERNGHGVVPVVMCKDCKHRKPTDKFIHGYECELIKGYAMNCCWYCADGERKDGEQE